MAEGSDGAGRSDGGTAGGLEEHVMGGLGWRRQGWVAVDGEVKQVTAGDGELVD